VADDHRPDAFGLGHFQPASVAPRTPPRDPQDPPRAALALRALRPPVTAAVRVEKGRPEAVRSAVANGQVMRFSGPWRTTGGWWTPEERFAYDCFDVQTSDGTVSRLRFDRVQRIWQIDAVYD